MLHKWIYQKMFMMIFFLTKKLQLFQIIPTRRIILNLAI